MKIEDNDNRLCLIVRTDPFPNKSPIINKQKAENIAYAIRLIKKTLSDLSEEVYHIEVGAPGYDYVQINVDNSLKEFNHNEKAWQTILRRLKDLKEIKTISIWGSEIPEDVAYSLGISASWPYPSSLDDSEKESVIYRRDKL